jgi:uncharacterized protein YeaO (DUF488 family)
LATKISKQKKSILYVQIRDVPERQYSALVLAQTESPWMLMPKYIILVNHFLYTWKSSKFYLLSNNYLTEKTTRTINGCLFMVIKLKRAYEKSDPEDGKRILVEKLWPRGLKKEETKIDAWLKNVAPSTELRKWYAHDPNKWAQFKERYWKELDAKPEQVSALAKEYKESTVTFVFGSREEKLNNATALKEYIERKIK